MNYDKKQTFQTIAFSARGRYRETMNVFLVDDSAVIRQRLRRLLSEMEQVTVSGESGDAEEATRAILEQKPDVVLLDIHLNDGGSGIDVLQTVKQATPAPAVIIITNYPYTQYRQKCLEAGADFFSVKSTEFDRIVPTLEQLIQKFGDASGASVPL